jgi:hypothetical protein
MGQIPSDEAGGGGWRRPEVEAPACKRAAGPTSPPALALSRAPPSPDPTPGGAETLYTWGNSGACVNVLAPGVDIFAACTSDARCGRATDGTYTWATGTSMAVRPRGERPKDAMCCVFELLWRT